MTDKKTTQSNFDQKFLDEIKQILLDEKSRLEKELMRFAKKNPNVSDGSEYDASYEDQGDDLEDNVHEIEQFAVNKTLEVTLEKELRDVKAALERLEKGTYGICKYTQKPISKKRLLARPTSGTSVEAKKFLTGEA